MSAYDKTSIQISRCKRILTLVDDYLDHTTENNRTTLRKALMEEFEAPAIAPPVAAGSVDIEQVLRGIDQDETESDGGWWETSDGANVGKKKKAEILAWGAQQREAGCHEGVEQLRHELDNMTKLASSRREWAEKVEAELAALLKLMESLHNPQ